MTYSAALFPDPRAPLEEAQRTKYRRLAERLQLQAGPPPARDRLRLGRLRRARAPVRRQVTAITISEEQLAFARRGAWRAGLAERVDVRVRDYRDVVGRFDRIASIEMFEAVGERYWPVSSHAAELLAPAGLAACR